MDNYGLNSESQSLESYVSSVMKRVYFKMFLALIVTAVTAWVCSTSYVIMNFMLSHSWTYLGLLVVELIMVFSLAGAINKLSDASASLLFYAYSIVNGIVFSMVLMAFTTASIYQTFFITAGVFGAMSIYGKKKKNDLT